MSVLKKRMIVLILHLSSVFIYYLFRAAPCVIIVMLVESGISPQRAAPPAWIKAGNPFSKRYRGRKGDLLFGKG